MQLGRRGVRAVGQHGVRGTTRHRTSHQGRRVHQCKTRIDTLGAVRTKKLTFSLLGRQRCHWQRYVSTMGIILNEVVSNAALQLCRVVQRRRYNKKLSLLPRRSITSMAP